jgi:Uma2 family endonuclease
MAETDHHRNQMVDLIQTLDAWYAGDRWVYVSGNLLLFYERGNRRRHISPDVFVVKGVAKHERLNYLVWEEGKAPHVAIELTSSSTRSEDIKRRFRIYQDTLRVQEYFLFDPLGDYLDPPLRGYRLRRGQYMPVQPVKGRLPSRVLGLHLERHDKELRLYDPSTGQWLPTALEKAAQAEAELDRERTARTRAEAEVERLRHQVEVLRRRLPRKP